jgi:hypothetical protein
MDRRYADNAETPTQPFAVNALIASFHCFFRLRPPARQAS